MRKFRFMDQVFDSLEEVQTFAARLESTVSDGDQEQSEAVCKVPVDNIGSDKSPDLEGPDVRCEKEDETFDN